MAAITLDQVAHLAHLARIDMGQEELTRLAGELDVIVEAVASVTGVIAAAEVDGPVPATSHPIPLRNVVRDDVVAASLTAADALAGAPAAEDGRFLVPRILDED